MSGKYNIHIAQKNGSSINVWLSKAKAPVSSRGERRGSMHAKAMLVLSDVLE
jgi:hypothetical protein